jgi:alkylation response protein AidB-like acyl-CoA dehydrogenase
VLRAEVTPGGFVLDGFSPWVTGSPFAQTVVIGATLDDGREILAALPTELPGVATPAPPRLVGLSASQTGEVHCRRVQVDRRWLIAGPVENVMRSGVGAATGGLQTSTLAAGLSSAAIEFLTAEADNRPDLLPAAEALRREWQALRDDLLASADGKQPCTTENLRTRANSLVLRCAQAALSAAKGTGYVVGHPAGRWCREALFFLVWSCPQPVVAAHLCELAGIES